MIELPVADWARSLEWYRNRLGLDAELVVEKDRFALLRPRKGTRIALKQGTPSPGALLIHFEMDHLDAHLARLEERGVPIDEPIKESPEGYRRAIVRDPDGYRLCLFEWNSRRGARGTRKR